MLFSKLCFFSLICFPELADVFFFQQAYWNCWILDSNASILCTARSPDSALEELCSLSRLLLTFYCTSPAYTCFALISHLCCTSWKWSVGQSLIRAKEVLHFFYTYNVGSQCCFSGHSLATWADPSHTCALYQVKKIESKFKKKNQSKKSES